MRRKSWRDPFGEMWTGFWYGIGEGMGLIPRRGRSKIAPQDVVGRQSDVDFLIHPRRKIRRAPRPKFRC